MVRSRVNPDLPSGQFNEMSQIDKSFIVNQPGLQIINTVANLSLPLLIVNKIHKFIKDLDVPTEYRSHIEKLVLRNQDLFTNKDHTDTVKMHIDVGVNPPIKMRHYRTPIKNREVIDKKSR